MSSDPRKYFKVTNCSIENQANSTTQSSRRSALDALGNLEILNDVGLGAVGEGLRVLSSAADSIRVGESSVPGREGSSTYNSTLGTILNTAADAVDQGAQAVLDAVGLGEAVNKVGDINSGVANRAWGQAKTIFEKVKQGNFELSDIPEYLSDFQNLEILARGIFSSDSTIPESKEMCGASPYAVDLIAYAPKFNFLFVMDVQFSEPYQGWNDIGSSTSFVIKRSARPHVEFEHEDVNMYNFWTKVPRRTIYPPIRMSFYDDNKNAAHLFYTAYMRAMSPIANMMNDRTQTYKYEEESMSFEQGPDAGTFDQSLTAGYAASLGPLANNVKSIVSRIRLYHVFDYGRLMNIYNFYNPRILQFSPSELTMSESGEGAEFEFEFAYDGLFIEPGFSVLEGGNGKDLSYLTSNRDTATYAITPVFGDDDTAQDNSQQGLAPISQEQENYGSTKNKLGDFSKSTAATLSALDDSTSTSSGSNNLLSGFGGLVSNFIGGTTSSISGAINNVTGSLSSITNAAGGVYNAVTNTTSGVQQVMNSVSNVGKVSQTVASNIRGVSGSTSKNYSSGITGAINQVSNAFGSSSFSGSSWS